MNEYQPIESELELFILFHELDRLSYLLESRLTANIIPEISKKHVQAILKEIRRKRDWAFNLLPTFGVNPFKMTGKTITEEYRAWYQWWWKYLSNLPEDMRLRLLEDVKGSLELSENEKKTLIPSGSWKDLLGKC
jgi:hypothetical protein